MIRLVALGLTLVLLIGGVVYFLEHEVLVWLTVFLNVLKGFALKLFIALPGVLQRIILKKVVPTILLVGVIPRETRYKIKKWLQPFLDFMRAVEERVAGILAVVFGNKAALIIAILLTCGAFGIVYLFFGAYIVMWIGSSASFRPIASFFRLFWAGAFGRMLQAIFFRIVSTVGLTRFFSAAVGYLSSDLKSKFRAAAFGSTRRAVRFKRSNRERIRRVKERHLDRFRKKSELKELDMGPQQPE